MTFEFTTQIGCPVMCLKYCPQDIILKNYTGEKTLTLANHKRFLSTVPKRETIIYSGLAEPFANEHCIDMIEHAHEKGHKIWLFTTLVGVTPDIAERIIKIPFDWFCLHLPDSKGYARIPITTTYKDSLGIILGGVENITYMNMGGKFHTHKTEDLARGKEFPKKTGAIWCERFESPQYNVLPNGDVYFCCTTDRFASPRKGADSVIGNMHDDMYLDLEMKFESLVAELKGPDSICRYCPASEVWWKRKVYEFVAKR